MTWLRAVHRRLLPEDPDVGWTPYLWLFYLSAPVASWIRTPLPPWLRVLAALSLALFLALYFNGYWRWKSHRGLYGNIVGIALLGIAWTPVISAAMVFFIYASSFAGAGSRRTGLRVLLGIGLSVVATAVVFHQGLWWTVLTLCLCGMIGAANIYFAAMARKNADLRRSREEVEALATIAERERISRDLHDLLGHTLSLITLKAELARKLAERGDERAAAEIADVERISRDALRQVRQAVEGYRQAGLDGELARARLACETRDIEFRTDIADVDLESRHEAALAMVLREAVTNVVRHSRATRCQVVLDRSRDVVSLIVQNDGPIPRGVSVESFGVEREDRLGHGLLGMRERLRQVGGELRIETSDGWRLEARIPVDPSSSEAAPRRRPESETASSPADAIGDLAAESG